MSNWLPSAGRDGGYVRSPAEALDSWMPGIREIVIRHGITAASVTRFARGESPVFEINGQFVVKLLAPGRARLAAREIECLEWAQCTGLPVPALLGSGQLEDWSYLVSTRLPGDLLSERWPQLARDDQRAVAEEIGHLLATLHGFSLGGFCPGGILWPDFLAQGMERWIRRPSVGVLPLRLRESGPVFLARALANLPAIKTVFLHGDLAPENCLVSAEKGSWRISGMIDFGNAMAGHAPFDLTALTVLLAPGNVEILRPVFSGYGLAAHSIPELPSLLMAYTMLHPLGDIAAVLRLLPGLELSSTWDEVAERLWPRSAFS